MITDMIRKFLIGGGVFLALTIGATAQDHTPSAVSVITPPSGPRSPMPKNEDSTADHSSFQILQREFTSGPEVTSACLTCHTDADDQMMHSIHFKWEFDNPITGQIQGKSKVINSFCGNVAGNEPRCTSCHAGYGWDDMSTKPPLQSTVGTGWDELLPKPVMQSFAPNPDKLTANAVDCLACHDRSGQYTKGATMAGHVPVDPVKPKMKTITGAKAWAVDLKLAAQSVGLPGRDNCGNCHFYGGGGDNVKHGDLSSALYDPDKSIDVHMASEGLNFTCATCHVEEKHQWAGSRYNVTATDPHGTGKPGSARTTATCESCHSNDPHPALLLNPLLALKGMKLNDHTDKLACQTCHIPEFARGGVATKTLWDWSTAGKLADDGSILKLHEYVQSDGKELHTYLSTKGDFEWQEDVVPNYSWFNGVLKNTLRDEEIDPRKVVPINRIGGADGGDDTRIWPFKQMIGRQAYDSGRNVLAFSHVWGPETDTAFWTNFDWSKAVDAGMKAAGQEYSGEFGFVDTQMYWPITHMVAPAENALKCESCHTEDGRLEGITGIYLPGNKPFSLVGILGMLMVLGTLGGVLIHGLIRKFMNKAKGGSDEHA
ncbi:MAG: tetrathionate reductase family octaheme c-type cytochrome [Rhodobacteraceae bacterium]|nr:tetrathionate reductase family octaheme c-type cytochrome [Paracoccaceae bacterium]